MVKAAVLSPPCAVIFTMIEKAFVGLPVRCQSAPAIPCLLHFPDVARRSCCNRETVSSPCAACTESASCINRGEPRRLLILAASMSPVMTIGASDTTGGNADLDAAPVSIFVAKPSKPSLALPDTSLNALFIPFPSAGQRGRRQAPLGVRCRRSVYRVSSCSQHKPRKNHCPDIVLFLSSLISSGSRS